MPKSTDVTSCMNDSDLRGRGCQRQTIDTPQSHSGRGRLGSTCRSGKSKSRALLQPRQSSPESSSPNTCACSHVVFQRRSIPSDKHSTAPHASWPSQTPPFHHSPQMQRLEFGAGITCCRCTLSCQKHAFRGSLSPSRLQPLVNRNSVHSGRNCLKVLVGRSFLLETDPRFL